jgi:MFS family permease
MDTTQDIAGPRFATRLAFFAAGFTMACWAPLIPFAKRNVGVGDGELGLLLLCLGVGSLVAMPATGWVSARFGTRPVIIGGGLVLAVLLPGLILAGSPALLAAALFAFGAALGTLDVAMNVHAVEVEKLDGRPLMSGFHAMFSVGGLAGASGMTALLASGLSPSASTVAASALTGAAILLAVPRLLRVRAGEPVPFVLPHGVVLVIAALVAITFLVEAAMLDWGALLMIGRGLSDVDSAGLGFVLFSVAMVAGRLAGDRMVAFFGSFRTLVWGGVVTVAGVAVIVTAGWTMAALGGFVLVGLGASNIVPVLFSLAGRQTVMPAGLAVASVTTAGYAGILAGPAAIGFAAHLTSLPTAFWILAVLMATVPLAAGTVAGKRFTRT